MTRSVLYIEDDPDNIRLVQRLLLKLRPDSLKVRGVLGDLRTHRVGAVDSGRPTVGNVEQYQAALHRLGQHFNVLDNRPVGRGAVQRH